MTIVFEERLSDSPYIASITHGYTVSDGAPTRPAEINWHMVFTKVEGNLYPIVVGPWSYSGSVTYGAGAEILWIRFKAGVFMPHLPTKNLLNTEQFLPEAAHNSFWLHSSTWEIPDFENVEIFVKRLIRDDVLVFDKIVASALHDEQPDVAPRTIRHRFLQATGLSQNHIRQVERAQEAAALLRQGTSILDTVFEAGYYDQPHLTRSLKQFIGFTPAQLLEGYRNRCALEEDIFQIQPN